MSASKLAAADDDGGEGGSQAAGPSGIAGSEAAARARGKLVSQMMKKHLVGGWLVVHLPAGC